MSFAIRMQGQDAPGDRLAWLVPLYIHAPRTGETRQVLPIGIGTTDYLDGLFSPAGVSGCLGEVLAALDQARATWDACDWPQLRSGSPLLGSNLPQGWEAETTTSESCPTLGLEEGAGGLRALVPPSMWNNLQYYGRRAARAGRVEYVAGNAANLEELFESLLELHRARWTGRGGPGVLANPAVERMHRLALPQLLGLGVLRMYALRLDARVVAVYYGLIDHASAEPRRAYYYLGGFEPGYERLSPGTLLVGHAIQEAIREGAREFDFLRGREAYKYMWGARDRVTFRRRLWHKSQGSTLSWSHENTSTKPSSAAEPRDPAGEAGGCPDR
jgi:CelD/BcsL family acetyltransferase involved in cellulose biosynthesis